MNQSIVNLADSYKYGQSFQTRDDVVSQYGYISPRKSHNDFIIPIGLQYSIMEYLKVPTKQEVIKAEKFCKLHGEPFDREGWDIIVELGYLPIVIKAVQEGIKLPGDCVMATIESTDSRVPWIAGFVETLLLKVWYPTSIATNSYKTKQMLIKYGSPEWAAFALHNFGDRGSSSVESAMIGGFAHSAIFMGTDNFNSLLFADEYYGSAEPASYSVFATEHSTTTSNTEDGEEQFVYDMLMKFPDAPIMSFVADSYDVYRFTEFVTNPLGRIAKLIASRPYQKFIIRPDSGEPIEVIGEILDIMNENKCFDSNIGDKLLSTNYGILWGDGISTKTIEYILQWFTSDTNNKQMGHVFAAENFVFGQGGSLMHSEVSRDLYGFAMKCSSITIKHTNECQGRCTENIDVFKNPITDKGKASKKGRVATWFDTETKDYTPGIENNPPNMHCINALQTVYENGKVQNTTSQQQIRARIAGHI